MYSIGKRHLISHRTTIAYHIFFWTFSSILLFLTPLMQASHAQSRTTISKIDQIELRNGNEAADIWIRQFKKKSSEMKATPAYDKDAALNSLAKVNRQFASELNNSLKNLENTYIRRCFRRQITELQDLADFLELGATLIAAKKQNNKELLNSAISVLTIKDKDLREFYEPIGSMGEIDRRIINYVNIGESKIYEAINRIDEASDDLEREVGIRFPDTR